MATGEPQRTGLTRTATGLAVSGLGLTVMFGSPISYFAGVPELVWAVIGTEALVVGFVFLVLGLRAVHRSNTALASYRRVEREAEISRLRGVMAEVRGTRPKLEYFMQVANEYDDRRRIAEIEAQIARDDFRLSTAESTLRLITE